MFSYLCFALLALSSPAAASDPGCEELIKPETNTSKISGKWILRVATADTDESMKMMKSFSSSWIDISTVPSDNMTLRLGDRHEEKCVYGTANFTYEGNKTLMTFHINSSSHDHVGKHLETCADCILWMDITDTQENGRNNTNRYLNFFTRTGQVSDADLALFKKQASCLNFSGDLHFTDTKDLCPDEEEEEVEFGDRRTVEVAVL